MDHFKCEEEKSDMLSREYTFNHFFNYLIDDNSVQDGATTAVNTKKIFNEIIQNRFVPGLIKISENIDSCAGNTSA